MQLKHPNTHTNTVNVERTREDVRKCRNSPSASTIGRSTVVAWSGKHSLDIDSSQRKHGCSQISIHKEYEGRHIDDLLEALPRYYVIPTYFLYSTVPIYDPIHMPTTCIYCLHALYIDTMSLLCTENIRRNTMGMSSNFLVAFGMQSTPL